MSKPEDHENGRKEIAVAEADAAFEALRPLLRPEKVKEARVVLTRAVSKTHRGPIPSAEEMEHLERVLPGSADRCFRMAEKEQDHRHKIDGSIVDKEFSLRQRGQTLAIVGLCLLLIASGYIAWLGATSAAAALGGATIVAVVSIFVTGRAYDAKESGGLSLESPAESEEPPKSRTERRNEQFNRK